MEKSGLKKFCKSEFNLVKNHDFLHYLPSIVFFEAPQLSSTELGELSQKHDVKEGFKKGENEAWVSFEIKQ